MYVPKHFEEPRQEILHDLIEKHPLGTWVCVGDGQLVANPIPFLIDRTRGDLGTLVGHVARANPIWKLPKSPIPSLISFHGPNAYISPTWYASKKEHGKVVPTWNYITLVAHGHPTFIHDKQWLLDLVTRLTNKHEKTIENPWQVTDAPADYIADLLGAIVGVEIPIERLEGKSKMSQNRSEEDRAGVLAALGLGRPMLTRPN
jgi:transcriptional regulator